jgi:hypothetical protein
MRIWMLVNALVIMSVIPLVFVSDMTAIAAMWAGGISIGIREAVADRRRRNGKSQAR